jgi:hypothetical protein
MHLIVGLHQLFRCDSPLFRPVPAGLGNCNLRIAHPLSASVAAPEAAFMTHIPCPIPIPLPHFALFFAASASRLVASSSSAVSTAPEGRCTYRTTEPRMNMSLVEHCLGVSLHLLTTPSCPALLHSPRPAHPSQPFRALPHTHAPSHMRPDAVHTHRSIKECRRTKCGHRSSSTASALSSLMFRYWSTLLSVPRICTSFLSSTVISCSTSVLKKLAHTH